MNVRKDFEKLYTESTLKRPMTPSSWVSKKMEYLPITRITMSCGGGIGGSKWYEYVERIPLEDLADGNTPAVFRTWDGRDVLLNRAFMVKAEQYTIASAVLNSRNTNFTVGEWLFCYLVEDGHRITLVE